MSGSGGYGGTKGVLPGPGAKSGCNFVTGGVLGMEGDSTCNGILALEFDQTAKTYNKFQKRWKDLAEEYRQLGSDATIAKEQEVFRARIATRLEAWSRDDHFRVQFRFCVFSKIGGIVCRNSGRKRKASVQSVDQEQDVQGQETGDDGADPVSAETPEDDMPADEERFSEFARRVLVAE